MKMFNFINNYIEKIVDKKVDEYLKKTCPTVCTPIKKLQTFKNRKDELKYILGIGKINEYKFLVTASNGDESVDIWERAETFQSFYHKVKNFTIPEGTKYISEPRVIVWYTCWTGKEATKSARLYQSLNETYSDSELDKIISLVLDTMNEFPENFL